MIAPPRSPADRGVPPAPPFGDEARRPASSAPCEPVLVERPPAASGWLHEVKHDGFRVLVRKLSERVTVGA
jgi:ATP-dependent DNA ligase